MKKLFPFLLGLMAALPPFTTHVLLPAFPIISNFMHVTPNKMLVALSASYTGLLIGLLLLGPMSDAYGRKQILITGCFFYVASSLLCSLSYSLNSLISFLFLQSFGSSAILISAYAMARDFFSEKKLTDALASIAMAIMCVPLIAPFVGTALIINEHWQNVFYFLASFGILITAISFSLPTTGSPTLIKSTPLVIMRQYKKLFINRTFIKEALCIGLAMGAMFSFIGSSSIIYISFWGLSKIWFSCIFAIMGLAIFLANFSLKKVKQYRSLSVIRNMAVIFTSTMCFANFIVTSFLPSYWLLFSIVMFFVVFGISLLSSTLMSSALNLIKDNIASAASMIQLFRASIAMGAGLSMSLFLNNNVTPLVIQQLVFLIIMVLLLKPWIGEECG